MFKKIEEFGDSRKVVKTLKTPENEKADQDGPPHRGKARRAWPTIGKNPGKVMIDGEPKAHLK